jgi:hypothetical protein
MDTMLVSPPARVQTGLRNEGEGKVLAVQHDTAPFTTPCWIHAQLDCVPPSTPFPPPPLEHVAVWVSRQSVAIADKVTEVVFRQPSG